ncbi:MAG: ATP-binding cassette, subfamily bacterial CydCD [Nocardioidaceae bacterium]|jgi:ATP-binding cassette subfamily C protein CydCD|nr:ATP-binding cassette, subfamily bacterial CydCD [Nocardioidaceae bacterium]
MVVTAAIAQSVFVIAQAFVLAGLITRLVRHEDAHPWVVALGAVVLLRCAAGFVGDVSAASAAGRAGRSLRARVLLGALDASTEPGAARRTGELAVLATRGVSAVEPYLTRYVPAFLLAAVLPLLTVVAIATQDLTSAAIVAATLPLVPVFAALVGWATQKRAARQWQAMTSLAGHFVDVVQGLPTLVAFRRAEAQTESIRRVTDRYRRATLRTLRLAFVSSAVLDLVATLSVALVAVAVGLRLAVGDLDLRTALVVLLLAPEAYWPLRRVGAEFHAAAEGGAALAEIAALPAAPRTRPTASGGGPARWARQVSAVGPIELRDIAVTYPGRPEPALHTGDITFGPAGLTAVTGPSGAGKSTLLDVIRGALATSSGRVLVDGVPLDEIDPEEWRASIGWLPQRPWFCSSSVGDNVRLGRLDATDPDVWDALRQVDLADVVVARGGLDSPVGEDGRLFSAGERARLALARLVVSQRPLLLLDEPTAHLDTATEQVILETVRTLARRATVVVVAHRQAVADAADLVLAVQPPSFSLGSVAGQPPISQRPPREPELAHPRQPVAQSSREVRPQTSERLAPMQQTGRPARVRLRLLLGVVLGSLSSLSGVALTATAGWLIVKASERPEALGLLVAIVGVRTFGIARPALRYGERLVSHDAALRELADRRAAVYDSLVPLVPGVLGPRRGDLLASLVDDVDAHVDRLLRVRQPVVTALAVSVVATVVATLVLPVGGVALGLSLAFGGLGACWLASRGARRHEPRFVAARAASYDEVTEAIAGADELMSWHAGRSVLGRLDAHSRAIAAEGLGSAAWMAWGRALVLLQGGVAILSLALLAPTALADGRVSAPMFALVAFLALALVEVLTPVVDAAALAVRTKSSLERLEALGDAVPAVTNPPSPLLLSSPPDRIEATTVSAGWGAAAVLRGVSFALPRGGRLAVVGPTGSGKSTLAGLLVRFIDPTSGSVSLSGVDLRRLCLDDVRRSVGLVDDDPHVFGSTLVENVRLACPTSTDAEVEVALRRAHLGDWLDGLPDGLDTALGAGGAAVSGGERARIGLARIVLSDNPVVVLDEPGAHLDTSTAQAVLDDLLSGVAGRTVVMMTHRREGIGLVDGVLDLAALEPVDADLVRA